MYGVDAILSGAEWGWGTFRFINEKGEKEKNLRYEMHTHLFHTAPLKRLLKLQTQGHCSSEREKKGTKEKKAS